MDQDNMNFQDLIASVEVLHDGNAKFLDSAVEQAIADVAGKVQRYQKAGELTIKLKVTPHGDRKISIAATIATKLPQPSPTAATVYVDRKGRLCHDDPEQRTLPGMNVTAINK